MFRLTFYTFNIAYVLFLIGAYQAFRYNSPKRSVIIMSVAILLDVFNVFCAVTGFLSPRLTAGLGTNFHMTLGKIFGGIGFLFFFLSFIPYKKSNIQLHQRMILVVMITWFLSIYFRTHATVELLAPFRPIIP